jgi:hypothetical protein
MTAVDTQPATRFTARSLAGLIAALAAGAGFAGTAANTAAA